MSKKNKKLQIKELPTDLAILTELSEDELSTISGGGIPQVVPCESNLPPGHWGASCVGRGGGSIKVFTWYTTIA